MATYPHISDELDLLRRLERIEAMLVEVHGPLRDFQTLLAMGTDTADALLEPAVARGVDPVLRAAALLPVLEKLTEPGTLDALHTLLDRLETVAEATAILEQAPGLVAMLVDIFDDATTRLAEKGVDIEHVARKGLQATVQIGQFFVSEPFLKLLESGILDVQAISVVGRAGRALADIAQEPADSPPGLFGLLKLGKEEEVRRTLNFGLRFASRFGQLLTKQIDTRQIESQRRDT